MSAKKKSKVVQFAKDSNQALRALASAMIGRAQIIAKMGKSYGGERDIYTALGYNLNPVFDDYMQRYRRQDIATRIVDAPVNACWRQKPDVIEDATSGEETAFEKAWRELVKEKKIYHYLTRVDKISGIGQYGVLLMGFDDVSEEYPATEEVSSAKELLFLRPYAQNNVDIKSWEKDETNPRYGFPLLYSLKTSQADRSGNKPIDVHYSRVLHVAEGLLEDDLYGTPRLERVLNRLQDIELVAGGSAEMFWRGAFPGLNFAADADADMEGMDTTALETQLEEYVHGLKRYLKTQGISIEQLESQVASPEGHVKVLTSLISGATGIPRRMLIGSERGELASTQDEKNWLSRVDERRTDYAEPLILRPFIDKLIEVGVLPPVKEDGYVIDWPDLFALGEKDHASVSESYARALGEYTRSPGAEIVVPPVLFMKKFLGFTDEEVEEAEELLRTMVATDVDPEPEPLDEED